MRNKVIPLFIFFGLGKLNAVSVDTQDPTQQTTVLPELVAATITEESPLSSDSYNLVSPTEKLGPVFNGPEIASERVKSQETPVLTGLGITAEMIGDKSTGKAERGEGVDIQSVSGSSYVVGSTDSILLNISNKSFRVMMAPPIKSDNGEKFHQMKEHNLKFFNEQEVLSLAISTLDEKTYTSILEIYKSGNVFPISNGMFSVPLTMIMDDDYVSGGFAFYDLEDTIKAKLGYAFLATEIPGIEVLIKCAMHLISLYRFELSPCDVYTKITQEGDKDKYYKSFIVVRNEKAYLLTHSGAEELAENPISEYEVVMPSGNEISPKSSQPIYLFSVNLCGDFYKGRSDKSILQIEEQIELLDENLIAKGIEILCLLSCACNSKKKASSGKEFGRASILKNLPVVGPLNFFAENDNLKRNLMDSLEDFWGRKTKRPIKTIPNFSKFLTNSGAFQIIKPNFEDIVQKAMDRFKNLFPKIITQEFLEISSPITLSNSTQSISRQSTPKVSRKFSNISNIMGGSYQKNGGN